MTSHSKRAFTGNNVVLPGHDAPRPATVVVDLVTGKITEVHDGRRTTDELPGVDLVDAGDKFVLPGLVE